MTADDPACGEEEVLPRTETRNDPAAPAPTAGPTQVEGVALPRTGASTAPMVQAGLLLIAVGGTLMFRGRRHRGGIR